MPKDRAAICGHDRQIKYLEKLRAHGMPVSAFLFSGRDEVGKKTVALSFFAGLFCKGKRAPGVLACLDCESCKRIIGATHPDFPILAGEEEIGIDEVRELKRRLSLHSYLGSYRGVLIDDAHRLTAQAQGALLKMVEEPTSRTLFFFVTSMPHLLFETVRSRLLELSFALVSEDDMRRWAEINFPKAKDVDSSLAIAEGRPGRLMRFLENPEALKEEKARISKFEPLLKMPVVDQFLFSERLTGEGDSEIRSFFQFLIGKMRNRVLDGNAGSGLRERLSGVLTLYFQLETTNVNKRLLIDSAFLESRNL